MERRKSMQAGKPTTAPLSLIEGRVQAWHYARNQPIELRWSEGRITFSGSCAAAEAPPNRYLAPALLDLQVNGFAGIDFQRDDLTLSDLLTARRGLREAGCPRFFLTLITDAWPRLRQRLVRLRDFREQSRELQAAIAGWHIEGPFLSPEPGYHGAHPPEEMIDPKPAHLEEIRSLFPHDPILLTLAPERKGGLEAIAHAVSLGKRVSLGHTNASFETLNQAVAAGATGFTHLGNGIPQSLDRHDNIIWRVLAIPALTVSLIPDRIHLPPLAFKVLQRALEPRRVYYTTDAMAAAGAPPGRYTLGRFSVEVGPDQIVRQPGQTNLAGSALCPMEGVRRAAEMTGLPYAQAWELASAAPARFAGLPNGLQKGYPPAFCLLEFAPDQTLSRMELIAP